MQPRTAYILRVLIGNIASGTSIGNGFFPLDGFPGYRIELLAGADLPGGGVVIAQDDNLLAGSIPEGEFVESVVQLTTGAAHPNLGQRLAIRLINLNRVDPLFPASDLEVDFDDVRLDANPALPQVPALSPITIGLLAIGMALLGLRILGGRGRARREA